MRPIHMIVAGLFGSVALVGCGDGADRARDGDEPAGTEASGPAVEATGTVVEVRMTSIGGEHFVPADLNVRRGDVIRYVLESGVHNASFPPDSNPPGVTLPPTGPLLQLPGQTYDVLVDFPEGSYYYHCDPHAVLGMTGTIEVEG